MSFFDYIEKVRKKPESVRRKMALFWAVFITFVIAFVWITLLLGTEGKSEKNNNNYKSPFSVIQEVIKQRF